MNSSESKTDALPMLRVRGVSKSFKTGNKTIDALTDVSFDVKPGEIFGIVGESGSGKTTIGRIIAGLYTPDRGDVLIGEDRISVGTLAIKRDIKRLKRQLSDSNKRLKMLRREKKDDSKIALGNEIYVNDRLQNELKNAEFNLAHGERVNAKYKRRSHLAIRMVFQDPSASLNPRMTTEELVGEALLAIGVRDKDEIARRVRRVLDAVGMPISSLSRYPHEFSGGQKQRIGIARAIITEPRLLVADEPLSALDVSVGAQVANLILDLASDMHLSVVFIAHDLSLVRRLCDRVGVMFKGRMVELGGTDELFENPTHPYTNALLSAIPVPDPILAKNNTRVHFSTESMQNTGVFRNIGGEHYVLLSDGGDTDL